MKNNKLGYTGIIIGVVASISVCFLLQDKILGSSFRKSDLRKMEDNGMHSQDVLEIERISDSIKKNNTISGRDFEILREASNAQAELTRAFSISTMARIETEPFRSQIKKIMFDKYTSAQNPPEKVSLLLSIREANFSEWKDLAEKEKNSPDSHLAKMAKKLLSNPNLRPK